MINADKSLQVAELQASEFHWIFGAWFDWASASLYHLLECIAGNLNRDNIISFPGL